MNRSVVARYCGMVVLFCAFLTSCGGTGASSPEESPSPAPRQEQTVIYNLMEEKWAEERTDADVLSWNVSDCLEVSLPDLEGADWSYEFSAVEGSCYYVLQDMLTKQEEGLDHALYWTVTDAASGESAMGQWELQAAPEAETREEIDSLLAAYVENLAWITGMDVSGGKVFLFFHQRESNGEGTVTTHYYKAQADQEGRIEGVVDLLPALQESRIMPQEDNIQLPGGRCDTAGRCYVGDGTMSHIGVIDQEGKLLTVLEEQGELLYYIGKMPEGSPLYACENFAEKKLVIMTCDEQEQKELYRGEYELLDQCLMNPNGDMIYDKNGILMRWNVVKGTCEKMYAAKGQNFINCDGILEGADGKVFAVFRQNDGTFLYGFTDQEMETVVIRMELLVWGNDYIETCASEYTKRHPGVVIEFMERQEDTELQLNRIMAQISQGEGPELMLVPKEQLQALQKGGALAELSEVLPASDQEQIFPGVLENGKVGEGLYGITCGATFSTLLTSDQVWQGETWSLEDVMRILEDRERAGNPVEQFSDVSYKGEQAYITLYELVLANIGRCSLVDLQAGKCYFDTEEFRRVLEFCKKCEETTQNSPSYTDEENAQRLREGEILTWRMEGNLMTFSRACALLGEGVRPVGYPTDGKSGNLLMAMYDPSVVVNIHSGHREIVDDFLRYLLDYKSQRQYSTRWVRMDVLQDCVEECVDSYGYATPVPVFRMGNRSVIVLEGKKDGTSYLTEFLEMAVDSVPYETELDMIRSIVREETNVYFAGDRGLEETARIIQRRVQLYLDELK